jgi:serine/threonine-protein kinase
MSPEQCLGDEVDHRTDIFALGIVLYELTTGTRCFAGKSDFERMLSVVRGEYHSPSAIVSNYPLELEQVVRTALSPDPTQRFPSCHAMIEALERVAHARGWTLGSGPIHRFMQRLYAPDQVADEPTHMQPMTFEPEPTAREAPSARREMLDPSQDYGPTDKSRRRLARGTNADGFARSLVDEDDQPTRGRRPLPRRPSCNDIMA